MAIQRFLLCLRVRLFSCRLAAVYVTVFWACGRWEAEVREVEEEGLQEGEEDASSHEG